MNTALLLIDIQNDYFPGGANELPESPNASLHAAELLEAFRNKKADIIHILHLSVHSGAKFFIPGTWGSEIHESVRPAQGELIIEKNFPNSYRDTKLLEILKERDIGRLAITGMMTQMCVHAAVRASADFGFECVVCSDACAAQSLNWEGSVIPAETVHGAFLAAISGVYCKVVRTKDFVSRQDWY